MINYFSVLYDGHEDVEKIELEYYKEDINWNFVELSSWIHGPVLIGTGPGLDQIKSSDSTRTDDNIQTSDQTTYIDMFLFVQDSWTRTTTHTLKSEKWSNSGLFFENQEPYFVKKSILIILHMNKGHGRLSQILTMDIVRLL